MNWYKSCLQLWITIVCVVNRKSAKKHNVNHNCNLWFVSRGDLDLLYTIKRFLLKSLSNDLLCSYVLLLFEVENKRKNVNRYCNLQYVSRGDLDWLLALHH